MSFQQIGRRAVVKGVALTTTGVAAAVSLSACDSKDKPKPSEIPESEVPVGSGVVKNKWVVAQPSKGEFKAYSAVCPHQGCLVQTITKEEITCPCHNSVFKVSDGSHVSGPANKGLTPAKVEKSGNSLKVSGK